MKAYKTYTDCDEIEAPPGARCVLKLFVGADEDDATIQLARLGNDGAPGSTVVGRWALTLGVCVRHAALSLLPPGEKHDARLVERLIEIMLVGVAEGATGSDTGTTPIIEKPPAAGGALWVPVQ